jgi:hypothetical protein
MDEEVKQLLREIRDIGLRNETRVDNDMSFRRRILVVVLVLLVLALAAMGHLMHVLESAVPPADNAKQSAVVAIPGKVAIDDAEEFADDGMPFGEIAESDTDHLMQFAQEHGFDLKSEFQKACANDTDALASVFKFSLRFQSLDQNARTYGQAIYSSFLRLGEAFGTERYSSVVANQNPEVQQRVRDFIYFPVTLVPKKERSQADNEVRRQHPKLFPNDYEFGRDDPLFKR